MAVLYRQGEIIRNLTEDSENKPLTKSDFRDLIKEIVLQNKQ